ncbi:MAG TPA: dihydropteroate synthase [Thermopetrobacter sp.]|nr:dihydropteroate synthase [Thermopetrobacter sp.]
MGDALYLRPAGLVHGRDGRELAAAGLAGAAEGLPVAFTMLEVTHRCASTGERSRRWLGWRRAVERAESDAALKAALDRLTAPRAPLCGFDFSRPLVMGIVNVTPDSFSDGGRHDDPQRAIAHGRALAAAGADILDIGGESTRPGAAVVPVEEELRRVIPVIEALAAEGHVVSVDTRKAVVMERAVRAGARIVNDVSGLTFDAEAARAVAALKVPVVLMHMRGTPTDMMARAAYEDVVTEVYDELAARIDAALKAGVAEERLIIDPGLGFAKTTDDNMAILRRLTMFHGFGRPLLVGASRKRFIGEVTQVADPAGRVAGSLAVAQAAVAAGAQIVRVHDVAETARMARMVRALHA